MTKTLLFINAEELEGVSFDDILHNFPRDFWQIGAGDEFVKTEKCFHTLLRPGGREGAAEKELIGDVGFVGGDNGIIGEPGAVRPDGKVGEDVFVLIEQAKSLFAEGVAHISDDDFKVGEGSGDFVEQEGLGEFEEAGRADGAIVEEDGQVEFESGLVSPHRRGVSGVEAELRAVEDEAFEAEFIGEGLEVSGAGGVGEGIEEGEADHFLGVTGDVVA